MTDLEAYEHWLATTSGTRFGFDAWQEGARLERLRLLAEPATPIRVPDAWRIYREGKLIVTTRDVATLAAYRMEGCQEEAVYDEPATINP